MPTFYKTSVIFYIIFLYCIIIVITYILFYAMNIRSAFCPICITRISKYC
nr:MAG TPA: hypothetical protein [Caudoviricetes sp.]